MAAQDIDLTPVTVAIAVAGAAAGPKFAAYIGAYSLILIGWFAGLLFGLYTRSTDARMPVWAYTMFTLIVTLATTVPVSQLAAEHLNLSYEVLLVPIATAIPAMPDRWGQMGNWLLQRLDRLRGVQDER